jgi:anaerobic selenocysteine-containing dehydrogenase
MPPEAVLTGKPYPIKALIANGRESGLDHAGLKTYRKTLEKLDLVVTIGLFMSETAELSDMVLPACSFLRADRHRGYPSG